MTDIAHDGSRDAKQKLQEIIEAERIENIKAKEAASEARLKQAIEELESGNTSRFQIVSADRARSLPPIDYDLDQLLNICVQAMAKDKDTDIVLPVCLPIGTKKNKIHLLASEKSSPMGIILKNDPYTVATYKPYAAARFNANALLIWITNRMAGVDLDTLPRKPAE